MRGDGGWGVGGGAWEEYSGSRWVGGGGGGVLPATGFSVSSM